MPNKNRELHYTYPPDIEKCNKHRLAMRIFKNLDQDKSGAQCQCCERRIGVPEETGQCWYDNLKLAYLGPGIPLLFTFIKNSIILLVALVVIFTGFALYSNIQGTYCSSTGCSQNMLDNLAIINKISEPSYMAIQNYTLLAFVLVSIPVFQYIRYNFRRVEDECDDVITSPSDYALILRRLPEETTKNDIQKMIEDRRGFLTPQQRNKTDNLKVVNIVMSFSMSEYTRIMIQNREQFGRLLDEGKQAQFKPKPLPALEKTASFAIVIFSRQQSKQIFKYKPNICQKLLQCIWTPCIPRSDFEVKGQKIAVERAPQPDDIVWSNSKISMQGSICRKTIFSIVSILLLFAGGGVQYGLALAQVKASQDSTTQQLLSLASSVTVSVLNAIIQIFLVFASQKERNQTITEYNTVLMVKISFFQFLNTGIFVVVANFMADIDNFSLTNGLVMQITQVMILNAVLPNITLFILSYFEILPKIERCLVEKKKLKYTQIQANSIYQGPTAQIPYKYAYVFKTIWLTAFYAPLAPVVVIISLIGLIFNYLIEKCLFGKAYSSPNMLSSMVNDSAVELMQYFTLIISLGEYIVYLYFASFKPDLVPLYWGIPIYISIAISVLHLLLPMDGLNHKLFKMPKDNFVYPSYEQVDEKFEVTYEMTNPGYECNRKRKRDVFIFNKLFGPGAIQLTNVGFLGGMGLGGAAPNDQSNSQPQGGLGGMLAGLQGAGGPPANNSDNKVSLLGQQNNNIYQNPNNPILPGAQNNAPFFPATNNNASSNPFAAMLNPLQNNQVFPNYPNDNQKLIGPPNQPISENQINPSFNNKQNTQLNLVNNQQTNLGVPPSFGLIEPTHLPVNSSAPNNANLQNANSNILIQNKSGQQTNNLLSHPHKMSSSQIKSPISDQNNYMVQQQGRKFPNTPNSINNNDFIGLNPNGNGGSEPKGVNFFKNVPPGFNINMGPSYHEAFNRPTFGSSSINLNGVNLGTPIPMGSESESSYSSTKQIKKAFKLQNAQMRPFTQGRFL